jgi:glycosyltransferase involved in cell wall biosynthesis
MEITQLLNKLVCISHTSPHHSSYSGYSKLLKYIPTSILTGTHSWVPYSLRKAFAGSQDQSMGLYDSNSVQKELALSYRMIKQGNGLAHFLNGERDIRFSTSVKRICNWNFVATFHKPPAVLKTNLPDIRYIKRLDGAIAVGVNQLEQLSEMIGSDKVVFIPHGVDTDFFRPGSSDWDQQSVLFVGYHLRDFEMLSKVAAIISKRFPHFKLHVVVDDFTSSRLPSIPNMIVHAEISDESLLDLYQRSAALLLPLQNVTACNSILEALACGLPVVTTALPGHSGYLHEACSFQTKQGDPLTMADAVIALMEDRELNHKMRLASREQSLKFSWPVVAKQMVNYYLTNFN